MQTLIPGETINKRYVIESFLGVGRIGQVYLANQLTLSRRVALKVLANRETLGISEQQFEQAKRRFLREASLCAQLQHPNVITVYDYGKVDTGPCAGAYYFAMEYLPGKTLANKLKEANLMTAQEAVSIVIEVARGLREAHSHGLIHRDLKPDNIMIVTEEDGDTRVIILDFGLVREVTETKTEQTSGESVVYGTPKYIAPEQITTGSSDYRSDLYALGLIIYEAITGQYPYQFNNVAELYTAHCQTHVVPVNQILATKVSVELESLINKLLSKAPADRYQSADELLQDLRQLPEVAAPELGSQVERFGTKDQAIKLNTQPHYRIGTRLHRSTHTLVFEAVHSQLARKVAVKLMVPETPEQQIRIENNFATLALLRHPCNPHVYDIGSATSNQLTIPFLVMELVTGESLSGRIRRTGRLGLKAILELGKSILFAVGEAHALGIVHGELSPDQIIFTKVAGDENIKVLGYPVLTQREKNESTPPPRPTSLRFVAPEIVGGARPRESSDIYSIGQILRFAATAGSGVLHFDTPPEFATLLETATAPQQSARFESTREFVTALNSLDDLREHDRPMPRASLPSLPLVESEDNNPQIWVLSGDPATEGAIVMNAVSLLTKIKVDLISAMAHSEIIRLLDQQSLALPQILVFGLSHTASASQVLNWFAQSRFTRKVLVVPETSNAPITEIVNRWGLNGVITLPCTSQQLANQLEELLTPTNSCEMLADNAQVLRVHLHYVLAPTIVRVKINGSSIKVTYNDKGLVDILGLKVVP